jgi:acyl carrier protein
MATLEEVRQLLGDVLQLGDRVDGFDRSTPLLGNVAELDSMAIVAVITALEDYFGVVVEDDDISADTFETVGSLVDFATDKQR